MSHQILGERFLSRSEPAWHGLGTLFPAGEELLASEAVGRVAGDVQVVSEPLFYKAREVSPSTLCSAGKYHAIVRLGTQDADEEVLGVTSENWHPHSYVELAESLDELSRKYKVETAGLLQKGGLCFLALRGEDWDVGGEEMRTYFTVNLSLTPGKAHQVFHSPIRVVCWNTNTMAKGNASINFQVPHAADAKQRLGIAGNLVARFREMQADTERIFRIFQETPLPKTGEQILYRNAGMDASGLDRILEAAYPEPQVPPTLRMLRDNLSDEQAAVFQSQLAPMDLRKLTQDQEKLEKDQRRIKEIRQATLERYDSFEPAQYRGTVWAAYNAVTEVSDWRQGRSAAEGSMWGSRAREKARAFTAAMELTGLN
jgi:hypothetical protein